MGPLYVSDIKAKASTMWSRVIYQPHSLISPDYLMVIFRKGLGGIQTLNWNRQSQNYARQILELLGEAPSSSTGSKRLLFFLSPSVPPSRLEQSSLKTEAEFLLVFWSTLLLQRKLEYEGRRE